MIKGILFDYDGTIMDTNMLIFKSWRHLYMTQLGRECRDEEVAGSFGEELRVTIRERFPDKDVEALSAIYRDYQRSIYKDEIQMCEGCLEMLKELKAKGYKIAVATSRLKESTMIGLEKFGMGGDFFDAIITCNDVKHFKPEPDTALEAAKALGLSPQETILVGDSKFDMMCGHRAGMKTAVVDWTICFPEENRTGEAKPDYILYKPSDIFSIIE